MIDELTDALLDWVWRDNLDQSSPVCEGLDPEHKRQAVRSEFGSHVPIPDDILKKFQED
ncbi:hypothetical protein GP5015_77 [gamma proteobacterium HTCC5015]|nr:hypothetical protein GP5015_77 [gamma proteobacterium HTCC5015]